MNRLGTISVGNDFDMETTKNNPLDTTEYLAFIIAFMLHFEERLNTGSLGEEWLRCLEYANDFIKSDYNKPEESIYDCLSDYVYAEVM